MFDFLEAIPLIGGTLSTLLPFLIVLGVVVAIHEYGHYIVGRWCGIHAEVFSLGFGPVIKSWHDKRGTKWQLALIPLGGFVKFLGDADGASRPDGEALEGMSDADRSRTLNGASVGRRALTVVAGPVANFLLSIVVFAGLVMYSGVATQNAMIGKVTEIKNSSNELEVGDILTSYNGTPVENFQQVFELANESAGTASVDYGVNRGGRDLIVSGPYPLPPLVAGVEPVSPASKAGLKAGDLIQSVDGIAVHSFSDLRDNILASDQTEMEIIILRDGAELALNITPKLRDRQNSEGGFEKRVSIGVFGGLAFDTATTTPMPWTALKIGVQRMWSVIDASFEGIYHIFAGNIGADNLQGPLGIAQMSGDTASNGLVSLISLIAIISTAIGLMNLLPIPVLDGGHLILYAYEAIAGKPANDRIVQYAMSLGLSLLLMLFVFATYNDILRLLA